MTTLLNDERWLLLHEELEQHYSPAIRQRGFDAFKQDQVRLGAPQHGGTIFGTVEGVQTCKVTLEIPDFTHSRCDCPVQYGCRHLAAAWMALADRFGYPAAHLLEPAQQLQQAASNSGSQAAGKHLPAMRAAQWQQFFRNCTHSTSVGVTWSEAYQVLWSKIEAVCPPADTFTEPDWAFFQLHRILHVVERIKDQVTKHARQWLVSPLYRAVSEMLHALPTLLPLTALAVEAAHPRMRETLIYLEQVAQSPEDAGAYLPIYHFLWAEVISNGRQQAALQQHYVNDPVIASDPQTHERQTRERQTRERQSAAPSGLFSAYLAVQVDEPEIWQPLLSDSLAPLPGASRQMAILPGAALLLKRRAYLRLRAYLQWLLPEFSGRHGQTPHVRSYYDLWRALGKDDADSLPDMWSALDQLRPRVLVWFKEDLYEEQQWTLWVDSLLCDEIWPFDLAAAVFDAPFKQAPESLLPYYHQAAEHYLQQKNRKAYRLTTRALKRLKKIYLRLKRTEDWDRFIRLFAARTSRLRALQEEMKKGKLLP